MYSLIVIYLLHVVLMKMNHSYEVSLKKGVAGWFEVRELKRMANEKIEHFHFNLDQRTPCIEVLMKIKFKQEGDILIFDSTRTQSKTADGGVGNFMSRANQ